MMPQASHARPQLRAIIFETIQRCNHTCRYCYNVWHPADGYPQGELSTADTLRLRSKALDQVDCPHVSLTGGQLLLRQNSTFPSPAPSPSSPA